MYLTFDEYESYGGTLDETAFEQLEFEARAVIDWWTFNRLQNDTVFPEAVKRCMYKLISLINEKQVAMVVDTQGTSTTNEIIQAGITHESNDGVSTSYNTLSAKDAVDTMQNELENVVRTYLQGVRNALGHKLLYRGIYPNE